MKKIQHQLFVNNVLKIVITRDIEHQYNNLYLDVAIVEILMDGKYQDFVKIIMALDKFVKKISLKLLQNQNIKELFIVFNKL